MSRTSVCLVALLFSSFFMTSACAATPVEAVLQSFTACNGDFFYSIKNNLSAISKLSPLTEGTKSASISVESRRAEGKNVVKFSGAGEAFGLHLTGYFDDITSISPKEQYYYWGFFIAETPAEVHAHLSNHIKDAERLKFVDQTYARLEMHDGNHWVNVESPQQFSGKVPAGNIERVLTIEKSDNDAFPGTRLSCSIQGSVSDIVLSDSRPDLPAKDYPDRPKTGGQNFDAIPLNPDVQKLVSVLSGNELFKPKFRSVSMRYKVTTKEPSKPLKEWELVETYQTTKDELIQKREIYSSTFFVDRLLLWNLVQLKARLSDGYTSLTREIKVTPPVSLTPGQVLETEVVTGLENEEKRINHSTCTIGEKIGANEVHKLLLGVAIKVNCIDAVDGSSKQLFFLEELGMFIQRSRLEKNQAESVYELIDLTTNILEENRLSDMASKMNQTLPRMVDKDTRLDKTIGKGDSFQFNYTLVNYTASSGQKIKNSLGDGVVKRICSSKEMMENFIKKRVTVTLSYSGSDGKKIVDIPVSQSQCAYWQ